VSGGSTNAPEHWVRPASAFPGKVDLAGQAAPGPSESFVAAVVPGRCPFFGTRGLSSRVVAFSCDGVLFGFQRDGFVGVGGA